MSQTTQPDGTGYTGLYTKLSDGTFVPTVNTSGDIVAPVTTGNGKYGEVAVIVPSSTPVSLFGSTNGFNGTLVAIEVISLDDSNGTITLRTNAGTVVSLAKGSINSVRGASVTVANANFTASQSVTAVNSATSGAIIKATFTASAS